MAADPCVKCGGTGWIVVERAGSSGARRCECFEVHRAAEREKRAGIPPNYQSDSFDNFQLPADNPIARSALSSVFVEVRRYAREFPVTDKPGLLLIGNPGVGKTHLAVSAMKVLMARGFEAVFFDYQTLLVRIQRSWSEQAGAADQDAYRTALDAEILLLDDLGARRVSQWVEDTVAAIITHRCNERKPLIATTNLAEPEAGHDVSSGASASGLTRPGRTLSEVIGERARSRLFEMCRIVRMPAVEDYRMRRR